MASQATGAASSSSHHHHHHGHHGHHVQSAAPSGSSSSSNPSPPSPSVPFSKNVAYRPNASRNISHAATPSTLQAMASGIPTDLVLALLLDKTLVASSALLARHWLLTSHVEASHTQPTRFPTSHHDVAAAFGAPNSSSSSSHGSISSAAAASAAGMAAGQGSSSNSTINSWAITTVVFLLAALGQLVWFRVWDWIPSLRRSDPQMRKLPRNIGLLAAILFLQTLVWLNALGSLSATTVVIFTQFCEVWAGDISRSMRSMRSYGGFLIGVALLLSFVASVVSPTVESRVLLSATAASHHGGKGGGFFGGFVDEDDLPPSLKHIRPANLAAPSTLMTASAQAEMDVASYSPFKILLGHLGLALYAVLALEKERATKMASTEAGGRRRALVLACIAGAVVSFPLGIVGSLLGLPLLPPTSSLSPSFSASSPNTKHSSGQTQGHLAAYLFTALGPLILEPLVGSALEPHASAQARVLQGWPLAVGAAMIVGRVGFGLRIRFAEVAVGALVGWCLRTVVRTSPVYAKEDGPSEAQSSNGASEGSGAAPKRPAGAGHRRSPSDALGLSEIVGSLGSFVKESRSAVDSIMSSKDSRKIFQFLLLNLAFMVVQLLWGVWTNSLGLISDAIHMFFDCAAIGMGLFASVMSTWKTDSTFTFGYSRVETLSGFANGVFLILISVFIVFEAIQRIIEPPEMHKTMQLLVVSGMGLGVNLFGMFAIGGHHHHHHGHSHGHGHGHSHGHDHGQSHAHHGHDHHSHSSPDAHHSHDHGHGHSPSHSHSHAAGGGQACGHDHSSHSHSHLGHDHEHHGHSHSHDDAQGHKASNGGHGLHGHEHDKEHGHGHSHATHDHGHEHHGHDHAHGHEHHGHGHAHGHSHGHGHGHSHGHSHNMMGVYLHVMADTMGSVGVIISTLLIKWFGWTGFDPIASLFIAFLIVGSVIPLVLDAGRILILDISDHREEEVAHALKELQHVEGLASYSTPRFWPRDAETLVGSIRIQVHTAHASPTLMHGGGATSPAPTLLSLPSLSPVTPMFPSPSDAARYSSTGSSVNGGSSWPSASAPGPGAGSGAPLIKPEKVLHEVEAILKSHIPGLEVLTIQIERLVLPPSSPVSAGGGHGSAGATLMAPSNSGSAGGSNGIDVRRGSSSSIAI